MAAAHTKGHEEDKHTEMQEKNKKEKKNEKRKVGSKAQKQAKKIVVKASPQQQIFPSLLQSRDGDLAAPSAIFFLLSSATVSIVTAAAVEPLTPRTSQRKPSKTAWTRGAVATQVPLISQTGTLPHDLSFRFCIRRQQYKYGCPPVSPPPSLVITLVLCCVA